MVAGDAGGVVGPAEMPVHPSASGPAYIDASDPAVTASLSTVTAAVHDAGGEIVGQLIHPGGEETGDWEMPSRLGNSTAPTTMGSCWGLACSQTSFSVSESYRGDRYREVIA